MLLLTPGPTEIPEETFKAMLKKAHHRRYGFNNQALPNIHLFGALEVEGENVEKSD